MMQKKMPQFKKLLVLVIPLLSLTSWAQQDAQYTQYMYNTQGINPAYAGTRGQLSLAALYRNQWVGVDGAPESATLNAQAPIGESGIGLGLSIVTDKVGPTQETAFDIDFSYTIPLNVAADLSFGLKASGHLLDVRFSELNSYDPDDAVLQNDIHNRFSPNIGAGLYYHTDRFYLGLSVPRILETEHFDSSSLATATERMHWYLITGYIFEANPNLKIKPALLTKAVKGAPLQVDMSLNFMLRDRFVLGAAYRWDAALSALAGFHIGDGLFLGLAYDREVTELGNTAFNDGSFEVILRYDFMDKSSRFLKSPRFF
ncbi:hypothetical protein B7P33_15120 [Sediminicola luteus]|uniref:Type IX secretion system membrane protein PorP/SprF n=2 Tax=Sediminicola luteus TaxID=319238 RepID=A0A2A4G6K4_9FLAO|nr:hypothetical protein B7P33_15120 [Sediminicola luteus]